MPEAKNNLAMPLDDFLERYCKPAIKETARKMIAGEPLTEFEEGLAWEVQQLRKKRAGNSQS